ncbi:MAG: hypothetical protein VX317_07325, partial [Verrucomicrobiota bacterium]|nr:hypothetical protein [Verrucomicrobiota bacterium]
PWSDGERSFPRQWNGFGALQNLARSDPAMRQRVDHLLHRDVEEFYNLRRDPHCLANLLKGQASIPTPPLPTDQFRARLREFMLQVKDPALPAFDKRQDPEALQDFMRDYTTRATREIEELRAYEQVKGYRF